MPFLRSFVHQFAFKKELQTLLFVGRLNGRMSKNMHVLLKFVMSYYTIFTVEPIWLDLLNNAMLN